MAGEAGVAAAGKDRAWDHESWLHLEQVGAYDRSPMPQPVRPNGRTVLGSISHERRALTFMSYSDGIPVVIINQTLKQKQ